MKLSCIRKKREAEFSRLRQVKMSEKWLFHYSCFFLILLKSVILSVKKIKIYYNFHHWTNETKNKYTWFSCKIFVLYRKWKIKSIVILDVWSATHLEVFWMKQGVLFLHVSNVLGVCRGVHMRWHNHTPHMLKPGAMTTAKNNVFIGL